MLWISIYTSGPSPRVSEPALRCLGTAGFGQKNGEAIQYDEASRGLNQPDSTIDQACEQILISSSLHEEAYQRYGLNAAVGNAYLSRLFVRSRNAIPLKTGHRYWQTG